MGRALSKPGVLAATGSATLLSFCLGGQSLHASDLDASPQTVRSAALTDDATRPSKRDGGGAEQGDEADWLLAQGVPLNAPEGNGETILAGFPQSTPETVEEEVGKQHGLEIVKRFTLESLERRIVVFRIPDARAVADVVAALKADQRVSSAQASVRYAAPKPQTPDTRISEPKRSPDPHARQGKGRKGSVATRTPARPEKAPKTAQAARTAGPAPPPLRSRQQGSLVAGNPASLRFPTADEPFVNPGGKNK